MHLEANVSRPMCFLYSFTEQGCFSVSSDDLLTPHDVQQYRGLVEAADTEEISSFLQHGVFAHRYLSEVGRSIS